MQRFLVNHKQTVLLALLSTTPFLMLGLGGQSSRSLIVMTQQRVALCEEIAISCSNTLQRQDTAATVKQLKQFAERTDDLSSLRLIRFDGYEVTSIGDHAKEWSLAEADNSTVQNIRVPIFRNGRHWGSLEFAFSDDFNESNISRSINYFFLILLLNGCSFALLLRRSNAGLSAGTAVPRRVRNTLDTIAGGVVILDGQKRIVLANETFRKSCSIDGDDITGTSVEHFNWRFTDACSPWDSAMQSGNRCSGSTVYLIDAHSNERCFVVNATPIFDSQERLAGILVSFEDVTTLEQQKRSLMQALSEIETSREMIREQNRRLQELASKDALTGAWNRRALFEEFERCWAAFLHESRLLNSVMLDVDHFKKLNDTHGHAAGDEVLKDVARIISQTVGELGFVGRYGGEEFCIILPEMDIDSAFEVAERVRLAIAEQLAEPYHVTSSFGVSSANFNASNFQMMLEQSDQALYAAKRGGRNAVRCWSKELAAELANEQETRAKILEIHSVADLPVSYHAVASLHAALAYRDSETAQHSQRVAELSVAIGRGLLPISDLYILEIAGLLHDIGKIGVPDSVLLKPGKLTSEQWQVMETHARIGVEIVESSFSSSALSDIVRYHHYRYDGSNTPEGGPVGTDIPIGARIVSIADAFDAMVSDRVYRKGCSAETAFSELQRCAGTQFDPELVNRFVSLQIGWRPDSSAFVPDGSERNAVKIGHLTERLMHAYHLHDASMLADTLKQLAFIAKQEEHIAIANLAEALGGAISERDQHSWEQAIPILQDLVEICLTIQRAHVRTVAARTKTISIHSPAASS
jgi:diguanylate cyclase (GGDEF)-like protein/putative nucleotidyltransferase with HDIG domain